MAKTRVTVSVQSESDKDEKGEPIVQQMTYEMSCDHGDWAMQMLQDADGPQVRFTVHTEDINWTRNPTLAQEVTTMPGAHDIAKLIRSGGRLIVFHETDEHSLSIDVVPRMNEIPQTRVEHAVDRACKAIIADMQLQAEPAKTGN